LSASLRAASAKLWAISALGGAQDDPRVALAIGLRLPAHRVLQRGRDRDVADLDRFDDDPPFLGLGVDRLAQFLVHRPTVRQQHGEVGGADHLAQRCLCRPGDRLV
jgi:hypothetical protein